MDIENTLILVSQMGHKNTQVILQKHQPFFKKLLESDVIFENMEQRYADPSFNFMTPRGMWDWQCTSKYCLERTTIHCHNFGCFKQVSSYLPLTENDAKNVENMEFYIHQSSIPDNSALSWNEHARYFLANKHGHEAHKIRGTFNMPNVGRDEQNMILKIIADGVELYHWAEECKTDACFVLMNYDKSRYISAPEESIRRPSDDWQLILEDKKGKFNILKVVTQDNIKNVRSSVTSL